MNQKTRDIDFEMTIALALLCLALSWPAAAFGEATLSRELAGLSLLYLITFAAIAIVRSIRRRRAQSRHE